VKKITIENIVGASTPFPFDRKPNEAFNFFADIEIGIHAVVERYGSSSLFQALLATKRFKAGSEMAAATPAPFPALLGAEPPDEVLRDKVEVEFTAYCRDLDIERVEPKSVRFKSG
jgi:hypothetical protein